MRPWIRRSAIGAATLVLALGLLVGLVLAVAHGLARDALRETVEQRLGESLGVPLRIEGLGGVLYREIELRGLTLGDPDAADRSLLSVDRAVLTWKGSDSLRFEDPSGVAAISASSLRVEGALLRIVRGQPLPWESGDAPSEGDVASTAPPSLALEALQGEALRVEVVGRDGARLRFDGALDASELESGEGTFALARASLSGDASTARRADAALRALASLDVEGALRFEAAANRAASSAAVSSVAGESSPAQSPDRESTPEASTSGRLAWRVDRLRVDGASGRASGEGSGDASGLDDATVDFEVASVSALLAELSALELLGDEPAAFAGGAARGSLALRGPWRELSGTAALSAEGLEAAATSFGDLALRARSEAPGELTIDELALRGGALDLRVMPGAKLAREDDRIVLNAWTIEVAPNAGAAPDAAPGSLRLSGAVPLAASDLASVTRDPVLTLDLAAEGLPVAALLALSPEASDALAAAARIEASVLDGDVRIAGDSAAGLSARGWVAGRAASVAAASGSSGLSAEGLELRIDLAGPIARSEGRLRGGIGRVLDGERAVGGLTLDTVFTARAEGEAGVADLRIEKLEWSGDPIPLRVAPGGRLRVSPESVRLRGVTFESGEQRLRAIGSVARTQDGGAAFRDLSLELEALSLSWLREQLRAAGLLGPDVSVAGVLAGRARLDGPIALPRVEADLAIDDFSSAGIDFDLVRFEARSPAATSTVALASHWRRGERDVLRFDLEASRAALFRDPLSLFERPSTRLALEAERFDLSVLDAFAPANVEAVRGLLDADIGIVGGSPAQVERGTFELSDGFAQVASPRQRIGPIDAVGRLSTGTIEIDRVQIGPPDARILASGRVEELGSGDERLSGELRFSAYPFKVTGLAKARLDGGLELGGRVSAPTLGGKLVLSEVDLWLPDSNAPELKEILVYAEGDQGDGLSIQEGEAETGIADRVAVDVTVELKRGSWARGRGVEAELSGDLRLEKPAGSRESYSGSIRTVRGTYEVYGRRFQIERGLATLDGAARIDPVLDILGKHRIRNVEIDARIGGRLSDPTLVFESSPELSQTDIASYLLLGRPAATASGDDAVAVQVTAARLATGLVSSELDRLLAPILPVDVIDLRVDSSEEEDAFALGVGKYIGERLFIRYDRRFGREVVDEFRAEYELTPRISVESSAATNGEAGGDVIFNLEY